MKQLLPIILLLFSGCTTTNYFPKNTVNDPNHESNWHNEYYSKALRSFGELSLYEENGERNETYRFLWLRTFHHPILIKLEMSKNGEATLTTKASSGKSAYRFGTVVINETRSLNHATARELRDSLFGPIFWESKITRWNPDEEGMDGAEWVIEAFRDGKYHVLTDWSPEDGIVYEVGTKLIRESRINPPEDEIY